MTQQVSQQRNRWRRTVIIVAVVLIVLVIFEACQLGGNTRFYATWIYCGQKPVVSEGPGYFNAGVNHYYEPSSLPGVHAVVNYFCTPLEAEKAGYSASPTEYSFPHLQQGA